MTSRLPNLAGNRRGGPFWVQGGPCGVSSQQCRSSPQPLGWCAAAAGSSHLSLPVCTACITHFALSLLMPPVSMPQKHKAATPCSRAVGQSDLELFSERQEKRRQERLVRRNSRFLTPFTDCLYCLHHTVCTQIADACQHATNSSLPVCTFCTTQFALRLLTPISMPQTAQVRDGLKQSIGAVRHGVVY